jgi:hypothetical protein
MATRSVTDARRMTDARSGESYGDGVGAVSPSDCATYDAVFKSN